jgi:putative endonuclease
MNSPSRYLRTPYIDAPSQHPAARVQRHARRRYDTYQLGLLSEDIVADVLRADGWQLLGHRVRMHVGEVDLILRRGSTIIFVEVKSAGPGRIDVEHAVSVRARHRIRRAAVAWMSANPNLQRGVHTYRFDVYIVRHDRAGATISIEAITDAF